MLTGGMVGPLPDAAWRITCEFVVCAADDVRARRLPPKDARMRAARRIKKGRNFASATVGAAARTCTRIRLVLTIRTPLPPKEPAGGLNEQGFRDRARTGFAPPDRGGGGGGGGGGGLRFGLPTPHSNPWLLTVEDAAKLLSTTPTALRARCRRHARRVGRDVVARLGEGVVAFKFGASGASASIRPNSRPIMSALCCQRS